MTVVGVSMVKDEFDIIEPIIRHMLEQVDSLVIADNNSTDRTRDVLRAFDVYNDRVRVIDDPEPAYFQSLKMTHLANVARLEFDADWIVPFDADEWWYSPFGQIAEVLKGVADQWLVVPAPIYNHVTTRCDDVAELDPTKRITSRMSNSLPLHKVACRWREDLVIEQGNHGASYTGRATIFDALLTVRHFPYRSLEQFIKKVRNGAAAYAAAGSQLPSTYGSHWRQWGQLSDEQLADVYMTWYHDIDGLVYDPVHAL